MNDPYRYVMRFHCPRCGIWFRSRDQYEWHMRRIHGKVHKVVHKPPAQKLEGERARDEVGS